MKAIITVGMGFGDEGKGATIDFLAREQNARLVVRYSGGAQAGHNVELPDGRRHTFSQFGSGTFAGAQTHLGPKVLFCPETLGPEADHLESLGISAPRSRLSVHPDCLVATHYHITANRLRERARGEQRHGSCGLGMGETRHYEIRFGKDAVRASDLSDHPTLIEKLGRMRYRLRRDLQSLPRLDRSLIESFEQTNVELEADLLVKAVDGVRCRSALPTTDVILFEGAQGVLLDESYGFHPHTTWSTVTTRHALEMAHEAGIRDVETLGITRSYATRHGAGPFPTACEQMSRELLDPGNPPNAWQGAIRSGPLDLVLLGYACRVDPVDALVVNHLDQIGSEVSVCRRYGDRFPLPIPRGLGDQEKLTRRLVGPEPIIERMTQSQCLTKLADIAPIRILGRGPTHLDRESLAAAGSSSVADEGPRPEEAQQMA